VHEYVLGYAKANFDTQCSIVELGAGSGALTARLYDNGFRAVRPYDLSADGWSVPEIQVKELDFNRSDWSKSIGKSPKLILAIEVIEHLHNPTDFVRQCASIIAPGASLIITTPNILGTASLFSALRKGAPLYFTDLDFKSSGHRSSILRTSLAGMADEAGFEMIRLTTCGSLPRLPLFKRALFAAANAGRSPTAQELSLPILFAHLRKR
jgi:2-polyprenyl-3-methyl-5-hydroxy-6-metoxy-1,4-benzoquinol methylase